MGPLIGITAALALIAAVGTSGAFVEFVVLPEDATAEAPAVTGLAVGGQPVSAAAYVEVHTQYRWLPPFESAESLKHLSFPCGATISQGMTSVTMSEPRCVRVAEVSR